MNTQVDDNTQGDNSTQLTATVDAEGGRSTLEREDIELRLHCLNTALQASNGWDNGTLTKAQRMFDFVVGNTRGDGAKLEVPKVPKLAPTP